MTTNAINNQIINDFSVYKTGAGTTVSKTIQQTNDSINASASKVVKVAGTSSGDAYTRYSVGATNTFSVGIDNSDSDALKLTYHAGSSTPSSATQHMKISTAGQVTKPLQPAFLAKNGADVANVTGDGTVYVPVFGDEIYDITSDFDGASGTFTAPYVGLYLFGGACTMSHTDVPQSALPYMTSSNRGVRCDFIGITTNGVLPAPYLSYTFHMLFDMDAGDTCFLQIYEGVTLKTATYKGGTDAAGAYYSYFWGHLKN
jgi:hypothetical protein